MIILRFGQESSSRLSSSKMPTNGLADVGRRSIRFGSTSSSGACKEANVREVGVGSKSLGRLWEANLEACAHNEHVGTKMGACFSGVKAISCDPRLCLQRKP